MRFPCWVHRFIYIVLVTGFLSACYMVFVVYRPDGAAIGPLLNHSKDIPMEFFMRRRLHALEAWITFGFLALYFSQTTYRDFKTSRRNHG